MVRIRGETVVRRPVQEVFDFVADERNEPRFNPRMTRAEQLTPGPVGRGTRWGTTVVAGGRRQEMVTEVTEYDPPYVLGSRTLVGGSEVTGSVSFATEGARTRMRWDWEVRPRGWMRLLGPVIARVGARQEREIWEGMRRCLEGESDSR